MRVGLVGYSAQKFDQSKALEYISEAFDVVEELFGAETRHILVSGLTNLGIPRIGYMEAERRCWHLVGIACRKAADYDCYPVHERFYIGNNWGDESARFLDSIDILIRIGGGEQSKRETALAREREILTIEYDLEALANDC
jgi:hypothetical protein